MAATAAASSHKRSKSDPPPITVEDTASGTAPQPSPSPTEQTQKTFDDARREPPRRDYFGDRSKGHRRKTSPNLEWHNKWTKDSFSQGRVLLIDYVAADQLAHGKRKIVAQEFGDIDGLRKFYRNDKLSQQAALRVIHVQNATWATRFLLRKFNIDAHHDLVGTSFGRWAKYERPQRRGGKPVLNGKTFRTQRDPWRGISRAGFGCDYLRQYERGKVADPNSAQSFKMMELNHYDQSEQPAYGYDVFVQRMSVYVQFQDGEPGLHVDPDIRNPYHEDEADYSRWREQYDGRREANGAKGTAPARDRDHDRDHAHHDRGPAIPTLDSLDNGSTIILFETSQSGSVQDTLVGARQEIEQRWRRLTFYLAPEVMSDKQALEQECMDTILRDIFKALAYAWDKYIDACEIHVGILEDKIYDEPADESRAPELWTNSSLWLKVERLMYLHVDIIKEMRSHLRELTGGDPVSSSSNTSSGASVVVADHDHDQWLGTTPEELEKLITLFQEGMIKPTENLSDLMYKSVGIRDARHSLQLGLSMWRLSWITFIFLPLTFVTGFFGMNVDTFDAPPSIKWWFVATVPLFVLVIASWYYIKHALASQRQSPLRRGVYESLYHDLAEQHPALWSRRGPREGVLPVGTKDALKWRLLTRWFDADKTVLARPHDPADETLGAVSRLKRWLVRRWLPHLHVMPLTQEQLSIVPDRDFDVEAADPGAAPRRRLPVGGKEKEGEMSAVHELLQLATPVALADADPEAASRLRKRVPLERYRSLSPRGEGDDGGGGGSASSEGGESGLMVEEKEEEEEEEEEEEGEVGKKERGWRRRRSFVGGGRRRRRRSAEERLDVPRSGGGGGGSGSRRR